MRRLRLFVPAVALAATSACSPFVNILTPTNGSTQTGASTHVALEVSQGADAPDNVEAQLDGQAINLSESHEATVEGVLTNGQHTVTATASNSSGSDTETSTFNVSNPLVSGSVLVLGDSINEQALDPNALEQTDANGIRTWFPNANLPAGDMRFAVYRGWSTATPEIIQAVADDVNAMRPEVLVLPLGTNESSTLFAPGWGQADIDSYNTLLDALHDDTWVVFVLPGHGVVAADQPQWVHDWAANIDRARTDILAIANARPNSVVIDWQVEINNNPGLISPDGIHLLPLDETSEAVTDTLSVIDAQSELTSTDTARLEVTTSSSTGIGELPRTDINASNLRQDFLWGGVNQARAQIAA